MNTHITKFRAGFKSGYNKILGIDDTVQNVGMEFGIANLNYNEFLEKQDDLETQLIILGGRGIIDVKGKKYEVIRRSVFRENPWAFYIPHDYSYSIHASYPNTGLNVAIIKAQNNKTFKPIVIRPEEIPSEQRGEGLAQDAMHRVVRAIFGDPNAIKRARPKEGNLIVVEVVNFPGRWSSYPPHYHPHPEIYYYRFDRPEGFGVSLIDSPAPIVRNHDVVKIMNCVGHAQVAAPGYAMWYLWFIRQIDGNRYEGNPPFKYFPEHEWVLDPKAKILKPEDIK